MLNTRTAFQLLLQHSRHLLCLTASLLFITACGDKQAQDAEQSAIHLKQAEGYRQQGQYRPAIIEGRNAVQKNPQDPAGHILLANIFLDINYTQQAAEQLKAVPEAHHNDLNYLLAEASMLIHRNKYESALKTLANPVTQNQLEASLLKGKALHALGKLNDAMTVYSSLPPDNKDVQLGKARLYAEQNNFHSAFQLLLELKQTAPEDPEVSLFEAQLAVKDGNLERTEALLTETLARLPNTDIITPLKANVMRNMASILIQQGRSSEAMVYTKALSEAYPGADLAQAKFKKALEHLQQGDLPQAKANLEEMLQDYPQFEQGAQLLGIISYLQGDYEKAESYFSENLDPETASQLATNVAAQTSLRLNQPDKVMELLGGSIDETDDPQALALYGMAAFAAGKAQEGEQALLKAVKRQPDNYRLRVALADLYSKNLNNQKALEQLQAAYGSESGKQDSQVLARLVRQYYSMGQIGTADTLLEKTQQNDPKNPKVLKLIADTKLFKKDYEGARQMYRKALTSEPDNISVLTAYAAASLQASAWDDAINAFEKVIQLEPAGINGYRGLLQAYLTQDKADIGEAKLNALKPQVATVQPYLVLAEHYTRLQQFKQAHSEIDQAQKSFSEPLLQQADALIAYHEAALAMRQEAYGQAKSVALEGLQQDPSNERLLGLLVEAETRLGNYDNARELAQQLEQTNYAVSQIMRAEIALAQKKTATALTYLQNSWNKQPFELTAKKIYGLKVSEQSADEANAFLPEWLEKLPQSPTALSLAADQALEDNDYQAAINYLDRVIALAPNSPVTLNNLAWAYLQTNNKEALSTAQRAYQLAPERADIVDTYGWILVKNKQVQEGLAILEKALALAPDNKEIEQHVTEAKKLLQR